MLADNVNTVIDQRNESPAPPLCLRELSKRFGATQAVRAVNLTLPRGEIAGLLGPNGAGKTTLIRLCAGWLEPDAGEILIDGLAAPAVNRRARSRLGVVSRDMAFQPAFNVREVLWLQATLYGLRGAARREACDHAIATYRLGDVARRLVSVISTGMYQRLAIAAALLHAPSLVLMDEPTTGLDPDVRLHIWDCLEAVRARGTTVLLSTHYLEEAARLCRTVHLMVQGRVAATVATEHGSDGAARLEREYLRVVNTPPAGSPL